MKKKVKTPARKKRVSATRTSTTPQKKKPPTDNATNSFQTFLYLTLANSTEEKLKELYEKMLEVGRATGKFTETAGSTWKTSYLEWRNQNAARAFLFSALSNTKQPYQNPALVKALGHEEACGGHSEETWISVS